jgi:hypothetical protein
MVAGNGSRHWENAEMSTLRYNLAKHGIAYGALRLRLMAGQALPEAIADISAEHHCDPRNLLALYEHADERATAEARIAIRRIQRGAK